MSARGDAGGPRRALAALAPLVPLVLAALAAPGCGGSAAPDLAVYMGGWQRVDGGEPDPAVTLLIERSGEGASVTVAGLGSDWDGVAGTTWFFERVPAVAPGS